MREISKQPLGVDLGEFPVMPYAGSRLSAFGSDKPDLRVKLEFTELTDCMGDVDFKVSPACHHQGWAVVVALRVPGGAAISRGEIDGYTELVKIDGARAWPGSRPTKWPRAATACNGP